MSDASAKPESQIGQTSSDQVNELLILAAADTLKKLVQDRRTLRETVAAQERELTRLRASNVELWRHVALISDSYRRLVTEFVAQLKSIDSAVGATMPSEFRPGSMQHEKETDEPV